MNWMKKHKFLTIVAVILLIAIVANASAATKPTTSAPSGDSTKASAPAPTPQPAKVSLDAFYAQIQNGQTKEQVKAEAGGRDPSNCSEMQTEYSGKIETCNYGGFTDGGLVMVQYTNEKVTSKSNSKF